MVPIEHSFCLDSPLYLCELSSKLWCRQNKQPSVHLKTQVSLHLHVNATRLNTKPKREIKYVFPCLFLGLGKLREEGSVDLRRSCIVHNLQENLKCFLFYFLVLNPSLSSKPVHSCKCYKFQNSKHVLSLKDWCHLINYLGFARLLKEVMESRYVLWPVLRYLKGKAHSQFHVTSP